MCLNSHKMKIFVIGCVFIAYFLNVLLAQKGCLFSVHHENDKLAPIMLYNNTSLIMPINGTITLKKNEVVTLMCPDFKNYLVQSNSNRSQARCIQGEVLRVANHDYSFHELECSKIIKGTVFTSNRKCGHNQGHIFKIGYQLSSQVFIKTIKICYDEILGLALYAEHLLHGQAIKYGAKTHYRPSFSTQASTVSAAVAYKQVYQKAAMNKLLKSAVQSEKYINRTSFLARGHLAPDADFLFAATQFATYYYINVCPQWQSINSANWKRVEAMVRRVAQKLQETLTIVTGTYDILSLPDGNNKKVDVFLVSGGRLPVPKFIWKIVYSKKSQQAIVLVVLNNPFTTFMKAEDFICSDICTATGWNSSTWQHYESGYVYCCNYKEFVGVVKTAPSLVVRGLLHNPK